MLILKFLSFLPFPVLYAFSDVLFFFSFYIIGYRRKIVQKNLRNAFPNRNSLELYRIEKQFYKNLADTSVETLKLLTISEKELSRRVQVDKSILDMLRKDNYRVFGMTSHFCNWEWLLVACSNRLGYPVHAVYQRLRNPFFDRLMIAIRSRLGVVMHEKKSVVNDIMKMNDEPFLMAMVADQRPFKGENQYWTTFMNQDSAFLTGTELLARRKDIKVVYASMQRIKRGYYSVQFKLIDKNPVQSKPGEITEKFIRFVDEDIQADPASYLWSHDRWKLKKPIK